MKLNIRSSPASIMAIIVAWLTVAASLNASIATAGPKLERIALNQQAFEHIQFGRIEPNNYSFSDGVLTIAVDESASLVMMPFETVRPVRAVRFEWQMQGQINTVDAQHENRRDGDDAVFKLGLLLRGEPLLSALIAPGWLKRVRELLYHPSEYMLNLIAGAKHSPGEQWPSPYNKRVTMVAVNSAEIDDGWWLASHRLSRPLDVVAIWLMADGDNTHSTFTTRVRNIELELAAD